MYSSDSNGSLHSGNHILTHYCAMTTKAIWLPGKDLNLHTLPSSGSRFDLLAYPALFYDLGFPNPVTHTLCFSIQAT